MKCALAPIPFCTTTTITALTTTAGVKTMLRDCSFDLSVVYRRSSKSRHLAPTQPISTLSSLSFHQQHSFRYQHTTTTTTTNNHRYRHSYCSTTHMFPSWTAVTMTNRMPLLPKDRNQFYRFRCSSNGTRHSSSSGPYSNGIPVLAPKTACSVLHPHTATTDMTTTTAAVPQQQIQLPPTTERMNLFTAVNNALHIAMSTNENAIVFGQDVAFGGVFRCTQNLQSTFGPQRVFNTPLSEVGILGFAIGYAATSDQSTAIAEIQFADYIFPALDQICNELAKFRYRSGNQWNAGGVTIRTPYGSVGHGGHYHSQSPESYLCHTPGLTVVTPRSPYTAKGLLLSSIRSPDPVIFLEPKALYRTAVEDVPVKDYEIPLSNADIVRTGHDITIVGYGQQIRVIEDACALAYKNHLISCEIIDLQTLIPWDQETVVRSVQKTGKCIVSHEAPITLGLGAEICAVVQSECFWTLQAPIARICGYDTPFPLVHEKYYVPNTFKVYDAILQCMEQAK